MSHIGNVENSTKCAKKVITALLNVVAILSLVAPNVWQSTAPSAVSLTSDVNISSNGATPD